MSAQLNNAVTLNDALKLFDGIQIVMVEARGHKATAHLATDDASDDSAIIEFIGGKPVIYHDHQYAMTNDPTYNTQLALLSKQAFSRPASDMPLPGNVNPVDRFQFQRAAYYFALLPKQKS
jgi:choloylglycine hydrolase